MGKGGTIRFTVSIYIAVLMGILSALVVVIHNQKKWFRCKKSGYFTKPLKNTTDGIFICHKQINNDTKSNSYSLKRQ